MNWYGGQMGAWGYVLGIISMVLFWGVLIVAIVAAIRYLGRTRQEGPPPPSPGAPTAPPTPEQVLAERFARGEIDEDEYRRRLDALHAPASH